MAIGEIILIVYMLTLPFAYLVIRYCKGKGWLTKGDGDSPIIAMIWPIVLILAAFALFGRFGDAIEEAAKPYEKQPEDLEI